MEDIDKLISKALQLNKVPDPSESLDTFIKSPKYKTGNFESDLESKRNVEVRNSKIPIIKIQTNNSRHYKTPLKSEFLNNTKDYTEINGNETDQQELTLKQSISEESKPEKLDIIGTEIKYECTNTLKNSKSKDILNHTHKSDFTSQSEINESLVPDTKLNYSKEKLFAAMKAIDDNQNIEFLDLDSCKNSIDNRSQIKEN